MKPRNQIDTQSRVVGPGILANDLASSFALNSEDRFVFSEARLDQEQVRLATLTESDCDIGHSWSGFRPSVALWRGHWVGAFLTKGRVGLSPTIATGDGEAQIWTDCEHCAAIDLCADRERLLLARIDQSAGTPVLTVSSSVDGRSFVPLICVAGWQCALGANAGLSAVVWCDDEGVKFASLGETSIGETEKVADGLECESPALTIDPQGVAWVAWHEPIGDGVLSWPRIARRVDQRWVRCDPPVDLQEIDPNAEAAGENQGWEFPTIASDRDGTLWLAGRSGQGFRVQAFHDEHWLPRVDLCGTGWGGRSRSCCFVNSAQGFGLLHGEPQGIAFTTCRTVDRRCEEPLPAELLDVGPDNIIGQPIDRSTASANQWSKDWPMPLFGDLHQHTIHSDGLGSVEHAYWRARHRYGHDFAAVTDHGLFINKALGPHTWRYLCELADLHDDPGAFVTLKAYEFTGKRLPGPGHKCVYFGDSVPEMVVDKDMNALQEVLETFNAIAVPHHVGWTGADLAHHESHLQPVWEICSVHGAYESEETQAIEPRDDVVLPNQSILTALQAGHRFGFIGGSDSHGLRWHHGVARKVDPWRCGLAGVFAERSRGSLLDALKARHCYATSGARILMHVDADGAAMGCEVDRGHLDLFVQICGTAPIAELALIVNGEATPIASGGCNLDWRGPVQADGNQQASFCYLRVRQEDGEMAWSSPIWFGV